MHFFFLNFTKRKNNTYYLRVLHKIIKIIKNKTKTKKIYFHIINIKQFIIYFQIKKIKQLFFNLSTKKNAYIYI